MPQFCVTYTNMLVSKNTKICVTPSVNAKICVSPMQNFRVGHIDFMLFVSLSLMLGSKREHNFQWNMGFSLHIGTFHLYPHFLQALTLLLVVTLHCLTTDR